MDRPESETETDSTSARRLGLVAALGSVIVGLALLAGEVRTGSATYDEVAYLRIAARWWRGGGDAEMTRMGSPVTFFKLQAGPAFWVLDRIGRGDLIDDPESNQARLLPIVRLGSLWIWAVGAALTSAWAGAAHGPRAMAFAAGLFTLSPNLLAHGALTTMEMPLVAATAGTAFTFWVFLRDGRPRDFIASAALAGLAFSCKFTAVLLPPILGLAWLAECPKGRSYGRHMGIVVVGMAGFVVVLLAADLAVTGFATMPLSARIGDHPAVPQTLAGLVERRWPQDWVGFATQVIHQRNGGPSYLLGERRSTGWWYYYPVALAVKAPVALGLLVVARLDLARRPTGRRGERFYPILIGAFLAAAMAGSKRNYGVRYLLPLAPIAIVWLSALAERRGRWTSLAVVGLVGQALAVASVYPHELSFFNRLAGGPVGGRRVLGDSNLDWGQGLRSLSRLERGRFHDLSVYYFGDTDPRHYGVRAPATVITANTDPASLVASSRPTTRYAAVSASLRHGPWAPVNSFRWLDGLEPVAYTDDATIAIYDLGPAPEP